MGVVVVLESKWGFESLTQSANLIKGMRRVALCLLMFFGFFVVVLGFYSWVSALDLKGDTDGWKSWAFVVQIVDAAVIPYPDEEAGQIPMAYVVRKPRSNTTEAQVMDFVAKQVAPSKKIRHVAFINPIPKSHAGKILRRELVTHALSTGSSKL